MDAAKKDRPGATKDEPQNTARRQFLNTAGVAGLVGAGLTLGVAGCRSEPEAPAGARTHMEPGELDPYYGLWSGGHTGDVRVLGIPSGREIHRIPCFVPDALVGWGVTNESKSVMGLKPDGSLKYTVGDTHHVHASYRDGNYDGRYAWVNDKINSRIARIRLDTFTCDRITELPNVQGFHGIFPDKADPVDASITRTTRVFCGSEFSIPLPNDGRDVLEPDAYRSLFTCVDAETMEVRWQALIDGNCDLVATSYDGKLAATNQYNTEMGVTFADMMSAERDRCAFFHIGRIEEAVRAGRTRTIGTSKVPVVDATIAANKDPATALVGYVSVPKNPHGVNASPDGRYFICAGKLSPTATVIELSRVLEWFDGKRPDLETAIVAEVEIGLGPLHTAFDGRGNAYTTLFLDSQVVKWNIDAAIRYHGGDKSATYVVDRLDVHYQPGHINASQSETKAADGQWLAVGCKFSKDRYLPVGPLHPENEQIIDISGERMVLVGDHPVRPEPHDFIFFKRELVTTRQIQRREDFPLALASPADAGVTRSGNRVTVKIASTAPAFMPTEFRVRRGDEVTIIMTNFDTVEDLTHGFAIEQYNVNFIVNAQETASATFRADRAGVFWCYCSHFCHALHLEMRARMIVEG